MSNNQPNRRPNATPKQETPAASTIPVDQEESFVQRVWETTYSSCLATILAPRAAGITHNDKYLVRDIHKALELANIAKDAARSYIQNQHKREEEELAAKEGDPLNKLLAQDQP